MGKRFADARLPLVDFCVSLFGTLVVAISLIVETNLALYLATRTRSTKQRILMYRKPRAAPSAITPSFTWDY